MIYQLYAEVYRSLRQSTGLTQAELAKAAGLAKRTIERIEAGEKLPCPADEAAIIGATACSRPFLAQLLAKAMGHCGFGRVTILLDAGDGRAATPSDETYELLQASREVMPKEQWWRWMERHGLLKSQEHLIEQQWLTMRRQLQAQLWALEAREGKPKDGRDKESIAARPGTVAGGREVDRQQSGTTGGGSASLTSSVISS